MTTVSAKLKLFHLVLLLRLLIAHLLHKLHLIGGPSVVRNGLDLGHMDAELTVETSAASTDKDTQVGRRKAWSLMGVTNASLCERKSLLWTFSHRMAKERNKGKRTRSATVSAVAILWPLEQIFELLHEFLLLLLLVHLDTLRVLVCLTRELMPTGPREK